MRPKQQNLFDPNSISNLMQENLLPKDGEVEVYASFFSSEESLLLFENLRSQINWKQENMKFYGKEVKVPRLTAWYGDELMKYKYSGIDMKLNPWTADLLKIKQRIENHTSLNFTSVLLNYYRDGNDSVGWHRDNEKVLRVNPVIASLSFGATRKFKFRHIQDHKLVRSIDLTDGMLILMKGETQHYWEHSIPKSSALSKPRINLTFRTLY